MRRLKFRPRADADLGEIIAYYRRVAPHALGNIAADIDDALDLIKERPETPAKVPAKSYRRYVTHRYRFKIAYRVKRDVIEILGIWRFQNRSV